MSKPTTGIKEWDGRMWRPSSEAEMAYALDKADGMLFPVHRWSGEDRSGNPLTIVWVAGPRAGRVLHVFEISGVRP